MSVELTLSLPGDMWKRIRDVRRRISEAGAPLPEEVRAAAVMVTSELVENAVKYGAGVADLDDILVRLSFDEARVSIAVSNGVASPLSAADAVARIEQIKATADRESLYIARLQHLLRSPGAAGGLGLYRIGFEGGFDLSCDLVGQVFTVRATRELP